ncbi:MAG: APC family permease [Phyllobacteriaceae bacterium]|nr:APC family permease [Phyllobacteriaceae bacterium]
MTDTTSQSNQLRRNTLGVGSVAFMVVSAAAPLTGAAAAIPLGMLLGNGLGLPLTFILITALMLVFAVGYMSMARHINNAGAFYAFTSRGLGGTAGGIVAAIALLSYNCMQIGLLGLLGGAAAGTFGPMGLDMPWWVWSLIAIALVGILGYRQVDLSAKILTVLVLLEYLIVFIVDAAVLFAGGDSGLAIPLFDFSQLTNGSFAAAVLFALGCFIGIEASTIYGEEAKDPKRTIPRATYLSIITIGLFFLVTSWLMIAASGVDKVMPALQGLPDPTAYMFEIAGRYTGGGTVPTIMGILFVTSIFAAVSAFHNYIARYTYVMGREGLLPENFGATHDTHQSPHIGSVSQTVCAVVVVGLFAVLGLDPILNLFTWISQIGTLGIIAMMALASAAVVAFFNRDAMGESALATKVAPTISGLIMLVLFGYIFLNYSALTGTAGALAWVLPGLVILAAVVGYLLAARLKSSNPAKYARMGENTK